MGNVLKVDKGKIYGDCGKLYAEANIPDGYYVDAVKMEMITKDGKWLGKPQTELGRRLGEGRVCVSISEYPALMDEDGQQFNFTRIEPALPVGSSLIIWTVSYNYYWYVIDHGNGVTILDQLCEWWRRFPMQNAWVQVEGKHVIDKQLQELAKINYGKVIDAIVKRNTDDYIGNPSDLMEVTNKKLSRSMGRMKALINEHLKPIGGEVLQVCPAWYKGLAMIGLRFAVNGIDPIHGNWVYCYKDLNFFYGPYCQRVRQKDMDGRVELMTNYPPKYTLMDWIAGPLYATAQEARDGVNLSDRMNNPPKYFQPNGVTILAKGTAYARETDGHNDPNAARKAAELANFFVEVFDPARGKKLYEEYLEREASKAIMKHGHAEVQEGTHEPYARVPFDGWMEHKGFGQYLLTDTKVVKVHASIDGEAFGHGFYKGQIVLIKEVENDWKWGWTGDEEGVAPDFLKYVGHFQLAVQNCGCPNCRNIRLGVAHSIMDLHESLAIAPEKTMNAVKTGDAGRYNLWRHNAI